MTINIINKSAHALPNYETIASAGMDLRANITESITLKPLGRAIIKTGLFIALPIGYEAQVRPRSGLAAKNGITVLNAPGTIDADYVDDMDGYVTHYRCAVRGDDIYSVNYQNSGEAYITVLKKGDDYYMIEGNCATKTTESMVKTYLNSAKTGCNFPTAAEIATMTTGTYEVNGKEYYAEIQKKNVYGNQVRYIYCFDGNVLKYRVVEGLYYTTDMKPVKNIITYNSISTKVNENLFDLSKYSILEN